jgi:hypothetical protein
MISKRKPGKKDKKGTLKCFLLFLFILSSSSYITYGQTQDLSFYENVSVNVNLKNMHTWHGFIVTPGAMIASSVDYRFYREKFVIGLWGGTSFNGKYTELSYYFDYLINENLKVSLVSHNNYSDVEKPNIFSWDKFSSPNFLDIVIETPISQNFPLHVYFSTILFGQGGDFETNPNTLEVKDSYSHYLELRYPFIFEEKLNITFFAGGAFSLFTEKTFYTRHHNLVNIGLQLQKQISFLNYTKLLKAKAFWNPESKKAGLEIDFPLL